MEFAQLDCFEASRIEIPFLELQLNISTTAFVIYEYATRSSIFLMD